MFHFPDAVHPECGSGTKGNSEEPVFFLSFFLFLSREQLWLMSNTATRSEGVCPHTRWCNKSNQDITSSQNFSISVAPSNMQTSNSAETSGLKILKQTERAAVLHGSQIQLLLSFFKLWRLTSPRLRLCDPRGIHPVDSRKAFNEGKTCRKHPHQGV